MTTQQRDTVQYQGDEYSIDDEPLATLGFLPRFMARSSANHRGYIASWIVANDKLFLDSMSGWVEGSDKSPIELLFPTTDVPVFAQWYSGRLLLVRGQVLATSDRDAWYQHELALTFAQGSVVSAKPLSREESARRVFDPILFATVNMLDEVPRRLVDQLRSCSIHRIGDLVQLSAQELQARAGLEMVAILALREALADRGLILGEQMHGWPPEVVT